MAYYMPAGIGPYFAINALEAWAMVIGTTLIAVIATGVSAGLNAKNDPHSKRDGIMSLGALTGLKLELCDAPDCVTWDEVQNRTIQVGWMENGTCLWRWTTTTERGGYCLLDRVSEPKEGIVTFLNATSGYFEGYGPSEGQFFRANWTTELSEEDKKLTERDEWVEQVRHMVERQAIAV